MSTYYWSIANQFSASKNVFQTSERNLGYIVAIPILLAFHGCHLLFCPLGLYIPKVLLIQATSVGDSLSYISDFTIVTGETARASLGSPPRSIVVSELVKLSFFRTLHLTLHLAHSDA